MPEIEHIVMEGDNTWRKVICAADCPLCDCCEEPFCEICQDHYAECECPGPTQDEIVYKEFNGVLYGREEY